MCSNFFIIVEFFCAVYQKHSEFVILTRLVKRGSLFPVFFSVLKYLICFFQSMRKKFEIRYFVLISGSERAVS